MSKTILRIFFFALISMQAVRSQNKIIDSLKQVVKENTSDSLKIKAYCDLCWHYRNIDIDSAFIFGNWALKLSKESNNLIGEAQAYNDIGILHYSLAKFDESIKYYKKSLLIRENLKDTLGIASLYNKLGISYQRVFKMDSAIFYATKALKIYEDKNNVKYAATIKNNIANIYQNLKQYRKALNAHLEIAETYQEINDFQGLTRSYTNIGNSYLLLKDTLQSLNYYKKGIEIAEDNNFERELSTIYNNYGSLLKIRNQFNEAITFFEKSLNIRKKLNDYYGVSSAALNLGESYLSSGQIGKAEDNIRLGLEISKKANAKELEMNAYSSLLSFYAYRKNTDSVLKYQGLYKLMQDSIFNNRITKEIAEVQEKYDTANREKKILTQRANIAEQSLALQQKNYQLYGLALLTIILGLIGYLFYNQQKIKNKQLQKENELKDALIKIETQNRLQEQRLRISRDLHDNIGAQLTFIISSVDNLKYGFKLPKKLTKKLEGISAFATSTIYELRDTIWAMNKSEIQFDDLQVRISNFIDKANIASDKTKFSFNVDAKLADHITFTSTEGMNVYRIIQEAIHNALKYAEATEINVDIIKKSNFIKISISDNGIGFSENEIEFGNGLNNIKKRASELEAEVKIISSKNNGTSINLLKPLTT